MIFILAILLVLPTLFACGRKITLDDAKYTMGKFFTAIGAEDYSAAAQLMHPMANATATTIEALIGEVERELSVSFADGISNIRYTDHEELPHNTAPGGSKFRVYGSMSIGAVAGVPFIISLVMDSEGYGISVIDIDGVYN